MARITEYCVIIDEEVLAWIGERCLKKYPVETGCFLFGEYWNPEARFKIPYITQASEPSHMVSDANNFDFPHSEVIRQTKLAAADGRMLLGWSHSHPYGFPFIEMNFQSILDARTQIMYRFTISLIVGIIKPPDWWPCAWKEGFAAPLDILVCAKKNKLITLKQWYNKKYKTKPWRIKLVDK